MYNLCKCEKPKLILSAKAYRLRKENLYNDTIAMITELFLSKALDDSEFAESGNLTLDIIRIKGYDENKKIGLQRSIQLPHHLLIKEFMEIIC